MTLADMVSFVCTKVNQVETEDQATCRLFLRQRHEMIWRDQLWKDSLFEYQQTILPTGYDVTSTWMPTKQVLLLPTQIDHVVAVRTALRRIEVESSELFYRSNFDAFSATGDSRQFRDLPKAVWDFDTAQVLFVKNGGQTDTTATFDTLEDDNLTIVRTAQNLPSGTSVFGANNVSRIDTMSKLVSDGDVSIGTAIPEPFLFTVLYKAIAFTLGVVINGINFVDIVAHIGPGASAIIDVAPGDVLHFWVDTDLSPNTYTVTASGELIVDSEVGFTFNASTADITPVVTIPAAKQNALQRCRIQLIGGVPNPTTVRILGKARVRTFTDNNDEPAITGMENCLMSFAQGDMLQRERRYGQAKECYTEGTMLLEQLKKIQIAQQAYSKRLIPSGGYGMGEYGLSAPSYTGI